MRKSAYHGLPWVLLTVAWTLSGTGCLKDFSSPAVPPGCGNDLLEAGELCDGTDFGGNTCSTAMGAEFGELQCTAFCLLDFTDCHNCGNGIVDSGEDCDDGNSQGEDGCSRRCQLEPGWSCVGDPSVCSENCGDGLVVGQQGCDDGNTAAGDGCSELCESEPGWVCDGQPSVCAETCGNGVMESPEACDDGNLTAGDGCSASCVVEQGWLCEGALSVCAGICGDGLMVGDETCDDGNIVDGDGCLQDCTVETGWTCDFTASPPVGCTPVCGDGLLVGSESCDDGNTAAHDGCTATCTLEPYFGCDGEPSQCVCAVYVDVDAPPTGVQSGASWATAYGDLRDGLQAAQNRAPCEIWVAEGIYYAYVGGTANEFVPADNTALYGGFSGTETARSQRDVTAHVTVLSAEQEGNPTHRVNRIVDADSRQGVVIDGFTITGSGGTSNQGGGLRVMGNGSVIVRNCVFDGNSAQEGGAMYLRNGTLTVTDSTFTNNSVGHHGGAISVEGGGVLVLERCLFEGNTAGDNGGALHGESDSQLTVDRCRFRQNESGGYGGAARLTGDNLLADLTGSEFWQNTSLQGGGAVSISGIDQPVVVTNCSFLDNDAGSVNGGSIRGYAADAQVYNSILWGSFTTQIYTGTGSTIALQYCDIQGGASGAGVIDSDPLFVGPATGDLRLSSTSPCIDAANGDLAPTADLDDNGLVDIPGITNSGVGTPDYADMGAYEHQP